MCVYVLMCVHACMLHIFYEFWMNGIAVCFHLKLHDFTSVVKILNVIVMHHLKLYGTMEEKGLSHFSSSNLLLVF